MIKYKLDVHEKKFWIFIIVLLGFFPNCDTFTWEKNYKILKKNLT